MQTPCTSARRLADAVGEWSERKNVLQADELEGFNCEWPSERQCGVCKKGLCNERSVLV